MKRIGLLLTVLAATLAVGQEAIAPEGAQAEHRTNLVEQAFAPNYSDLNCAGFISKESYDHNKYLLAGAESPATTQFGQGDTVFLTGGGYEVGKTYSIIRALRDPNRSPAFKDQAKDIAAVGQPYQELGHVRVTAIRGSVAVADVDFSCTAMVAGDLVVPYVEKQPVQFRPETKMERFPAAAGSVTGRILMAKDFDVLVGTGQKVYLNVGSSQGVKVGDYFRAVRSYDPKTMQPIDALAYKAKMSEDTMYQQPEIPPAKYADLPLRTLGEMVVLSVTPTSSTAMVTGVLEHINVGDVVQLEGTAAKE